MTDKKICVYAICKNESKHIYRWLESVCEADYVVVLDTGSTDGSYEMLKNDNRVTRVEQQVITPWRFDVARNESMKLVPEDAEILFEVDLDEVVEAGWADVLRQGWEEGDTRCYYTYAWSHNDVGEPTDVFKYDKIHTKDYHWVYPVHEVLEKNDPDMEESAFDAQDAIYIHHFPDVTKSRSSYFDLLKVSVRENPKDCHCRMLLAREYLLNHDYDTSLKEYYRCTKYKDFDDPKKFLIKIETYSRIADIYFIKEEYDEAIKYYTKALKLDPTHKDPYLCIGEIYNRMGLHILAKGIAEAADKYCVQHFDWTERKETWSASANDIIAVASYHLKDYDTAVEQETIAMDHNPNDIRIVRNLNYMLLAKYQGIENKDVYGA